MADIKTRKVDRTSIKTMERSVAASHRIRNAASEIREAGRRNVQNNDESANEYANSRIRDAMSKAAGTAETGTVKTSEKTALILRKRMQGGLKPKGAHKTDQYVNIRTSKKKYFSAEKMQKAMKSKYKTKVKTKRTSRRLGKKTISVTAKGLRMIIRNTKAAMAALAAVGSTAVIIIIVCVLFCTMFCVFEDSSGAIQVYSEEEIESFEEGIGIGSTDIVKVAGTQIGNWNGRKFWSWYGFGSRQPWCACFVSWCANQCGYIKAGVIPKFALVTDGINWFKKKGEWKSRKYKPRPGDIIFFDWYGDGSRDHVGIVESCDGRYVHTIEGNSSNLCRRRTYPVGWYEIYGYGTPNFSGPDKKKSEKKNK